MDTKIMYIGHNGTSLDDFKIMLETEPLEPCWGNPIELTSEAEWVAETPEEAGEYKYLVSGNFHTVSCAFQLWTNDQDLIDAIILNLSSPEYKQAFEAYEQGEKDRKDHFLRERLAKQTEREDQARRTLGIA